MKKLFLVRHAKSSWENENLKDKERPLNDRGKRDAEFMGKLMSKKNIKPDFIITSPAVRALTTAEYFCKELGFPIKKLVVENKLYAASPIEIFEVIKGINSNYNTVMLFAHNPGLTDLSNFLSERRIDNIPTCGIFSFDCDIKSWKKLEPKNSKFNFFEYPKKYDQG